MIPWSERPLEVRNLLNPAFCARVIYATIAEYEKKTKKAMPFVLVYLILPLVLHKKTREIINSKTALTNWVQNNQTVLIGFGQRAKDLVAITNEALELLLQTSKIILDENAHIQINTSVKRIRKHSRDDDDNEIFQCIVKAEHVARWFANSGKVETIYVCLGVRP